MNRLSKFRNQFLNKEERELSIRLSKSLDFSENIKEKEKRSDNLIEKIINIFSFQGYLSIIR